MNKKGDTQKILLFTFYLMIAFIIIYSSTSYLKDYFNGMEFTKEFLAKDLGLTIDASTFSPSEIEITYNSSKEIIAESKNNKLKIKLKDLEMSRDYNFISKINDFSIKNNEIKIKKDNGIKVS